MQSESSPSWLPPVAVQDLLVFAALALIVCFHLSGVADSASTGWHLKSGLWILGNTKIPQSDFLLGLAETRPWVANQWLGSVTYAEIYRLGSWPLLYAFVVGVFTLGYLGVLFRGVAAITGQRLLTSLAIIAALQTGLFYFSIQPVLLSSVLFIFLYVSIHQSHTEYSQGRPASKGLFLTLPPLFMVWANVHPHFVLGLAFLAMFVATAFLDSRLRAARSRLMTLLLLCAILATVNPYGPEIFSEALLKNNFLGGLTAFRSPWALQFGIAVLFLAGALHHRDGRALSYFEIASLLLFGWLALNYPYLAPYFAIVAVVPIVHSLHGLLLSANAARIFPVLHSAATRLELRERRSFGGLPLIVALLGIGFFNAIFYERLPLYEGPFGPEAKLFPYGALEVLRDTDIEGQTLVVAAPVQWGGFISLYGEGIVRPLVDDRVSVVGEQLYKEFADALRVGGDWKTFIKKYQVTHLLLSPGEPLAASLKTSGEMLVLYQDSVSVLFDAQSAN